MRISTRTDGDCSTITAGLRRAATACLRSRNELLSLDGLGLAWISARLALGSTDGTLMRGAALLYEHLHAGGWVGGGRDERRPTERLDGRLRRGLGGVRLDDLVAHVGGRHDGCGEVGGFARVKVTRQHQQAVWGHADLPYASLDEVPALGVRLHRGKWCVLSWVLDYGLVSVYYGLLISHDCSLSVERRDDHAAFHGLHQNHQLRG